MAPKPLTASVEPSATSTPFHHVENPLENFVILQEIFPHCSANWDTVTNIRLVNKTWKEACAAVWRSYTIPVKIVLDGQDGNQYNSETFTPLSRFLQQKRSSDSKPPPRSYQLEKWRIYNNNTQFLPSKGASTNILMQRFWNLYGTSITFLKLQGCTLDAKLFTHSFLNALPNMNRLILVDCVFDFAAPAANERAEFFALRQRFQIRYSKGRPLSEDESLLLEQNIREAMSLPHHQNLKSLQLDNVVQMGCRSPRIFWNPLILMFSNLEHISFGRGMCDSVQVNNLLQALDGSRMTHTLRQLDFTEKFNNNLFTYLRGPRVDLRFDWNQLKLTKLHLNLGIQAKMEYVSTILEAQAPHLKTLLLYRPKLAKVVISFPCQLVMPQLTELDLQGNPCANLDFLKLMPNLRVLKWNSSFYYLNIDYSISAKRICSLVESTYSKPVENTKHLEKDFKLIYLETLELECGQITEECWKSLGKWFPNLKLLKGNITGDKQLEVIAKQWLDIEQLELSHDSKVSAQGILDVVSTKGLFQKLRSFTWKPCPSATRINVGEEELLKLSLAASALKKKIGRQVVLPWIQ